MKDMICGDVTCKISNNARLVNALAAVSSLPVSVYTENVVNATITGTVY